jgi:hypothetical protein
MSRRLIITADAEPFRPSQCTCQFCTEMHRDVQQWPTVVPRTRLQRRMIAAINRIEKKVRQNSYTYREEDAL